MIKPFIFAACDQRYYDLYGAAFLNSARAAGHEVEVFCDGGISGLNRRAHYSVQRFRMLPGLLTTHPAVLMLDVDSIVREPVEIGEEYDLGLFPRLDEADERKRMIAGIFYCTDRATDFAWALTEAIGHEWGDDQRAIWQTYEAMKDKFKIKKFTNRVMDWDTPTKAKIFTAKGLQKIDGPFLNEVAQWRQRAA